MAATDPMRKCLEFVANRARLGTERGDKKGAASWRLALVSIEEHALQALKDAGSDERRWWITTDGVVTTQTKVAGPFSTREDALTARAIKEQYSDGQTYWVAEGQ